MNNLWHKNIELYGFVAFGSGCGEVVGFKRTWKVKNSNDSKQMNKFCTVVVEINH